MALLAKRVSASSWEASMVSTSVTPSARAASHTASNTVSSAIRAPDPDLAEPRGAGAVARAHHLLGLALAAIRDAPQRPVLRPGNGRTGVPEFRGDAAVAGVLQHADALAAANLPADLAAELEVVPLVVDRPAPVGLHVDAVAHAENLFERLPAGQQAHVGHADERQPRPAIGAHAAVRARLANGARGLARGHVAGEPPAADDIGGLRRHAFVIVGERD